MKNNDKNNRSKHNREKQRNNAVKMKQIEKLYRYEPNNVKNIDNILKDMNKSP